MSNIPFKIKLKGTINTLDAARNQWVANNFLIPGKGSNLVRVPPNSSDSNPFGDLGPVLNTSGRSFSDKWKNEDSEIETKLRHFQENKSEYDFYKFNICKHNSLGVQRNFSYVTDRREGTEPVGEVYLLTDETSFETTSSRSEFKIKCDNDIMFKNDANYPSTIPVDKQLKKIGKITRIRISNQNYTDVYLVYDRIIGDHVILRKNEDLNIFRQLARGFIYKHNNRIFSRNTRSFRRRGEIIFEFQFEDFTHPTIHEFRSKLRKTELRESRRDFREISFNIISTEFDKSYNGNRCVPFGENRTIAGQIYFELNIFLRYYKQNKTLPEIFSRKWRINTTYTGGHPGSCHTSFGVDVADAGGITKHVFSLFLEKGIFYKEKEYKSKKDSYDKKEKELKAAYLEYCEHKDNIFPYLTSNGRINFSNQNINDDTKRILRPIENIDMSNFYQRCTALTDLENIRKAEDARNQMIHLDNNNLPDQTVLQESYCQIIDPTKNENRADGTTIKESIPEAECKGNDREYVKWTRANRPKANGCRNTTVDSESKCNNLRDDLRWFTTDIMVAEAGGRGRILTATVVKPAARKRKKKCRRKSY